MAELDAEKFVEFLRKIIPEYLKFTTPTLEDCNCSGGGADVGPGGGNCNCPSGAQTDVIVIKRE
jgi:hypothetical protein